MAKPLFTRQYQVVTALMVLYLCLLWFGFPLSVRTAVKPIAVVIAGILAWGAGRRSGGHFAPDYGWRIGVGLVFSAIGDINLELSEAYPTAFKIGLVSFLIGHIFYVRAFETKLLSKDAWPFYIFGAVMLFVLYPGVPKDLLVPVIVYTTVILNMGYAAYGRYMSGEGSDVSKMLALAGALDFMVSDSVLAINKFRYPFVGAKTIVMLTYFSAQVLMSMSATHANRRDD